MKKQYISPEMAIVKIQTVQMIATSNVEDGFAKSGQEVLEPEQTSGNLSREGRGFWDDEDEY